MTVNNKMLSNRLRQELISSLNSSKLMINHSEDLILSNIELLSSHPESMLVLNSLFNSFQEELKYLPTIIEERIKIARRLNQR